LSDHLQYIVLYCLTIFNILYCIVWPSSIYCIVLSDHLQYMVLYCLTIFNILYCLTIFNILYCPTIFNIPLPITSLVSSSFSYVVTENHRSKWHSSSVVQITVYTAGNISNVVENHSKIPNDIVLLLKQINATCEWHGATVVAEY
jgi:hypothetical protein